jgi:hypothetical protein
MGPAGGAISTPDGELTLLFPAGALKEATAITIQPVENKVPGPFGKRAYVFGPAGLKTAKPVEVVRHYQPEEMNGTAPEVVGVAYQDADNTWRGRLDLQVDKTNQTLTTTVPDFGHPMGYYEQFFMYPDSAVLSIGQKEEIEIWYQKGRKDTDRDDFFVPLPGVGTNGPNAWVLNNTQIRNWRVNGKLQGQAGQKPDPVSGHFTPADEGAWGTYYAPAAIPPAGQNPVAISVELNLKGKGMVMLVGNFRIVSPASMTINGKKYENVDVVVSYSQENKNFSVSLFERQSPDAQTRPGISASVSEVFNYDQQSTFTVADNGTNASYTKISATDGKNTWGYAYHHKVGGTVWGPAFLYIKSFTGKSVQGTISGTLHNADPYNHKTITVSAEFRAAISN